MSTAGRAESAGEEAVAELLRDIGFDKYDASQAAAAMNDAARPLLEDYGGPAPGSPGGRRGRPEEERRRLLGFAQMEETTIDALLREMQAIWREHAPFADKKVADAGYDRVLEAARARPSLRAWRRNRRVAERHDLSNSTLDISR